MDDQEEKQQEEKDVNEKVNSGGADENISDAVEQVANVQNWTMVGNAAVTTLGWSEIARILLRILCNFIPALADVGKLNGKLKFYFSPISFGNKLDLAQLLIWLLLVVIWGTIIMGVVIVVYIIAYCNAGVGNLLECSAYVLKATIN
jgi:hypothetical protein